MGSWTCAHIKIVRTRAHTGAHVAYCIARAQANRLCVRACMGVSDFREHAHAKTHSQHTRRSAPQPAWNAGMQARPLADAVSPHFISSQYLPAEPPRSISPQYLPTVSSHGISTRFLPSVSSIRHSSMAPPHGNLNCFYPRPGTYFSPAANGRNVGSDWDSDPVLLPNSRKVLYPVSHRIPF